MSKPEWHRVTNVREFLDERGQRREGVHAFTKRVCAWPYCARCGLVLLKNEVTRKAARAACVVYE